MKRLHANQAEAIANALYSILMEKKRAARVLEKTVEQHRKWGARDRKLLYEATFSILRWKRLYSHLSAIDENQFSPWSWIKCWCILEEIPVPDWKEMDCPPFASKGELEKIQCANPAIATSFPDWLYKTLASEINDKLEQTVDALNTQADISIRANALLTTADELQKNLQDKHQIATEKNKNYPHALLLSKGRKLNNNPIYRAGHFEIQDANSQRIAPFCQVKPHQRVIDLCAGAGGKTLHLAALMQNKGTIKAFDVEAHKLRELRHRIKRAQVSCVEPQRISKTFSGEGLQDWADVVLIDAPCSGLGTVKRKPEIKWNLTSKQLSDWQTTQRKLLSLAQQLLKNNGTLVYATCSLLPSENEHQVEWFLQEYPNFLLETMETIPVHTTPFDGFFMARMKKIA